MRAQAIRFRLRRSVPSHCGPEIAACRHFAPRRAPPLGHHISEARDLCYSHGQSPANGPKVQGGTIMQQGLRTLAPILALVSILFVCHTAAAQKPGGVLKTYNPDSPGGMSIMEESTVFAIGPMMGVFNNLIMFDQYVPHNSLQSIVPDLATQWSWNEDGTALTFTLRQGVKFHDGKPFTSRDVKCSMDLQMGTGPEKLRLNPRQSSWYNIAAVTTNGDWEVTFQLKSPQPAFPMFLAGAFAAIYPCHVPPTQMRQHPIGTGPFKFVEYRMNESIKLTRNLDYWKPGRPYLDGIEYTIIKDTSTATLGFISGKFDMTFPYLLTIPSFNDIKSQMRTAICELDPSASINRHLLMNYHKTPFDNPQLRRAMALS